MSKILIIDPVTPKLYSQESALTEPLGGTEATVLRVSKALEDSGNEVFTIQRSEEKEVPFTPDVVITLRDAGHYITNSKKYHNAKSYLWLHDVVSGDYEDHLIHHLKGNKAKIIAVSNWHKHNIIDRLQPILSTGVINTRVIYNPLAEYCTIKQYNCITKPYNLKNLVFFSSPHKGLDYVLTLFSYLRNIDPTFTLSVANPGYYGSKESLPAGVTSIGSLPHKEVLEHVKGALCTFYPQYTFAETFGLVMAESNAVGTPVIAHRIGAAPEVLDERQLFDCRDYKKVVDTVIHWSKGDRPIVGPNKLFSMEKVLSEWKKIL